MNKEEKLLNNRDVSIFLSKIENMSIYKSKITHLKILIVILILLNTLFIVFMGKVFTNTEIYLFIVMLLVFALIISIRVLNAMYSLYEVNCVTDKDIDSINKLLKKDGTDIVAPVIRNLEDSIICTLDGDKIKIIKKDKLSYENKILLESENKIVLKKCYKYVDGAFLLVLDAE